MGGWWCSMSAGPQAPAQKKSKAMDEQERAQLRREAVRRRDDSRDGQKVLRQEATVLPGGKVEVVCPELAPG